MTSGGGTAWQHARDRCPKAMQHGPCAGVTDSGDCEVPGAGRCTFVDVHPAAWPYEDPAGPPAAGARRSTPFVLADVPAAALSAAALRASAAILRDHVDAGLLGDHGGARVQFPPSYRARILSDAGLPAWAGLTCRDRTRTALEGEVAACLDAGVAGMHCVTGDHPARDGSSAAAAFDLDSLELAQVAAGRGVPVSVAHAPSVPPRGIRLPRVLAKIAAGADTVIVDHCGGPDQVAAAIDQLRAAGFAGTVLACVPVVVDEASARVLLSFAAGRLPAGYVEQILQAPDHRRAGIAAATDLAHRLLAAGADGVDLSGGTEPGRELPTAEALAEIGAAVRATAREGALA